MTTCQVEFSIGAAAKYWSSGSGPTIPDASASVSPGTGTGCAGLPAGSELATTAPLESTM